MFFSHIYHIQLSKRLINFLPLVTDDENSHVHGVLTADNLVSLIIVYFEEQ